MDLRLTWNPYSASSLIQESNPSSSKINSRALIHCGIERARNARKVHGWVMKQKYSYAVPSMCMKYLENAVS